MTSSKNLIQAAAGVGGGFYPYAVDYSVRFNAGDSPYLYRTLSGSISTWTLSFWIKRGVITSSSYQYLWSCATSGSDDGLAIASTAGSTPDGMYLFNNSGGLIQYTDGVQRDPSAFMHIVLSVNAGTATVYKNNVVIGSSFSINTLATTSNAFTLGAYRSGGTPTFFTDGYMAEVAFIDGSALTPSSFGEDKNGIWVPKDLSGLTFGTDGFWLDFADSSNLGNDVSGNNNDFTSSGLTSSDQVPDTPTNNFCTFNPLAVSTNSSGQATLADGNLVATMPALYGGNATGTFAIPSSGKWYFEVTVNAIPNSSFAVGLWAYTAAEDFAVQGTGVHYYSTGNKYVDGSSTTYGASFTTNDVIGVAIDVDASTVTFYKNNSSQGSISYNVAGFFPVISDVTNASGEKGTADFGQLGFTYTPPTGYLALCTANLPEPTIGPNSDTTSDEHFDTVLWTATGSTQNITGLEFQPDFVWMKDRDNATQSHWLFDVIRGAGQLLYSNLTNVEANFPYILSSFNTDGFTTNSNANTGDDFVAWNWKGNGSGVTNTDGSITSTVSANQDAGISIVTYTGNATANATIGHGLGVTPQFFMVKSRSSTGGWWTYHVSVGKDAYLDLSSTAASASSANYWGSTGTTSTTLQINGGGGVNNSGSTYVAYCFAEIESFSSFGTYTGNGSTDGPFVYTGFRPAFVMVKRTNSTSNWLIQNSKALGYNPSNSELYANLINAEGTADRADFLSNGFKPRINSTENNATGSTYLYMAFAENPFKYSNAR